MIASKLYIDYRAEYKAMIAIKIYTDLQTKLKTFTASRIASKYNIDYQTFKYKPPYETYDDSKNRLEAMIVEIIDKTDENESIFKQYVKEQIDYKKITII